MNPDDYTEYHYSSKIEIKDIGAWIKTLTPGEWHLATMQTSYQGDQNILYWVISQSQCELSTALTIFWQGFPTDTLSAYIDGKLDLDLCSKDYTDTCIPTDLNGHFIIQKKIADGLENGFYKNCNIGFPLIPGVIDLAQRKRWHQKSIKEIVKSGKAIPWHLPEWAADSFEGQSPIVSNYSFDNDYTVRWSIEYWKKNIRKPR